MPSVSARALPICRGYPHRRRTLKGAQPHSTVDLGRGLGTLPDGHWVALVSGSCTASLPLVVSKIIRSFIHL